MSEAPMSELNAPEVRFEVRDRVGVVTLDRPRAINALTHAMVLDIERTLLAWADDDAVARVRFEGAGERGFCSGADVRALRDQVLSGGDQAVQFFTDEYRLNALITHYPKPTHAVMTGITMGGGMGLSVHCRSREGDRTTQLAMPETTIGLFPDVGALFPLSRMPGRTGEWMALTGASVDASSALWAGLLTEVDELETHPDSSALARARGWIDECFSAESAPEILARLREYGASGAGEAADLLAAKSPLSVAVTLQALRRARSMSTVDEVLAQDLALATRFMTGDSDFVEGVRAQLVDKDRSPTWRHASLDEVSAAEVDAFFG
ncbi:enoyl-CoA hydratase/isomerase family protein [Aestuariimicrobium soli]|uniref:enoyl-CoA hydratase/isomerase family protein n=1 Tax=Aestuariimicrobium soli TaxID=2035834 RepID=UPI003EBE7B01